MLIYDHNKQFIGIDDEDLKQLGFATAATLFEHCSDFADLFVKRPGYIHNFKNFAWIDFVLHAEAEDSKAIIHTPKQNFSCTLAIKPFHLAEAVGQSAYAIYLQSLKALSDEQNAQIAHDISAHPTPMKSVEPITPPSDSAPDAPDLILPDFESMPAQELSEPDPFDVPIEPSLQEESETPPEALKLDVGDIYSNDDIAPKLAEEPTDFQEKPIEVDEPKTPEATATPKRSNLPDIPMLGDKLSTADHQYIENLQVDKEYRYDPQVAADELGLPVDLIEEFIGDFIQQAHDFHDPLFDASNANDMDNIKTLSHKLKGVAANLRIEDAFEVLSIVNTSHDIDEISANLKYFYHLLAKLEGKESSLDLPSSEESEPLPSPAEPEISLQNEIVEEAQEEPSAPEPVLSDEDIPIVEQAPVEDQITVEESPAISETQTDADDEIYPLETPDTDEFDIPQQPPVVEESSDADALFELKTVDDEPMLIVETEDNEPEVSTQPIQHTEEALDVVGEEIDDVSSDNSSDQPDVASTLPSLEFDVQKTADDLGLSVEIIDILVQDFKSEAGNQASAIQEAIGAFEPLQWQLLAKDLKGISDNLRLNAISYELQVLSSTNDAQQAKSAFDTLQQLINQL